MASSTPGIGLPQNHSPRPDLALIVILEPALPHGFNMPVCFCLCRQIYVILLLLLLLLLLVGMLQATCFIVFHAGSCYGAQASLEFAMLLPQRP